MFYISPAAQPSSITSQHVTVTLHIATKRIGFQKLGFYPHEIRSHYLWSGGAMTLHLAGISKHTIKITEWWRSDAFLIYLEGHVASFTKEVDAAIAMWWFTHTTVPIISPLKF